MSRLRSLFVVAGFLALSACGSASQSAAPAADTGAAAVDTGH